MKKWVTFVSVFCLAVVIAACGTGTNVKETSGLADNGAGTEEQSTAAGATSTSELVITAKNYEFDKKEYTIKAGETVHMTLNSVDGVHGVSILKSNYTIGNKKTVAVKFDKPGTYNMICSVPCGNGHQLMKAKLVVE